MVPAALWGVYRRSLAGGQRNFLLRLRRFVLKVVQNKIAIAFWAIAILFLKVGFKS